MRERLIRRKKHNLLLLLGMIFLCVSCSKATEESGTQEIIEVPIGTSAPAAEDEGAPGTIIPSPITAATITTTPTATPTPTPIPAWKQVGEKWECGSEQYHIYHEEIGYADTVLGLNGKLLQITQFLVEPEDYSMPSYCAIQMSLYNPNTNTVEVSKDYPWNGYVIYNTGLLDDNRFYVFEDEVYCYNIYNEALELEKQLSSDGFCYDNGTLSSDGEVAYYGEIGGTIYRVTMDGEEVLYQNKAWEEPYAKAVLLDNRYLEVNYYTTDPEEYASHTAYLDLQTLEIVEDLEGTYTVSVSPDGELCLLQSLNPTTRLQVYRTADRSLVSKIDFQTLSECYNYVLDWENAICLTYTECSDEGYRTTWEKKVYDLHTGEVKAAVVEEETQFGYEYKSVMLGSGVQAAYMTDREAVYYLSLWDYMNETCTDTSAFFPRYGVISEELKQYRDELEKKHGVFFYIGTEVAAADFAYECQVVTDERKIYEALQTIDEILGLYPDGFFEQLKTGGIRNLGFYLAGNLKGEYASTLDYADAFASDNGYERCIVLDIRSLNLRNNLIHEISHWIDNYIERKELLLGTNSFENEYAKLNPENFEYLYSYVSGESVQEYIYHFDEPERLEEFYFIDSYAQTYPTEDRARCFEYLMSDVGADYYKSPHIYQKMKYIAESIRKYFDTTGWPEKTIWELALERVEQ